MTKLVMTGALAFLLASVAFGQSNLNFNSVSVTTEAAIRLSWNSTTGEVYEIQCTDSLVDTNTGTATWQTLYRGYPAQGSNTFWLDTGNYHGVPPIVHPRKAPARFYRIVHEDSDTASSIPAVSLISPTNGSTASGELTISITASTDQAELTPKFYVDGEEMRGPLDSTNWVDDVTLIRYYSITYAINTCEWPNGPHVLFATAQTASVLDGGPANGPASLVGHGVSAFVPITFSNLVTRISFSEPYFNPAAGQTQQVSAVFAADANWTLQIKDVDSNVVRTATGSGPSMQFNWDGNGDNGTNVPPGVYYYYISAQTNGQPSALESAGSGSGSGFSAGGAESTQQGDGWYPRTAREALAAGLTSYFLRFPPLPPYRSNGVWIARPAPPLVEIQVPEAVQNAFQSAGSSDPGGSDSPDGAGGSGFNGPTNQDADPAPQRAPTAPRAGSLGKYGIAFQRYTKNGASGFRPPLPLDNNNGIQTHVKMADQQGSTPPTFRPLPHADDEALGAWDAFEGVGWEQQFFLSDDAVHIEDLRGSGTPFNSVDVGFLILHGTYGVSQDLTAGGCKQMYFPVASGTSAQYIRMSEMSFGGDGTNGLKWMAFPACVSLYHLNWQSMQDQHVYPYTPGLHLLLGSDTVDYTTRDLGRNWINFMAGKPPLATQKIREAWYAGATKTYVDLHQRFEISPIKFAVAGDSACQDDMFQTKTNTVLSGGRFYESRQVYPPQ